MIQVPANSEVWELVKSVIEERLTKHRSALEAITLPHDDNVILKARIAECKSIINEIEDYHGN